MLAFDAHILSWNIDDNPPNGYTRHHIKEASFHGVDSWTLELTIKTDATIPPHMVRAAQPKVDAGALTLTLSGMVEGEMWPGKKYLWKQQQEKQQPDTTQQGVMNLFERISDWMEEEKKGSTDLFMMHTVITETTV